MPPVQKAHPEDLHRDSVLRHQEQRRQDPDSGKMQESEMSVFKSPGKGHPEALSTKLLLFLLQAVVLLVVLIQQIFTIFIRGRPVRRRRGIKKVVRPSI